jgi:hypothetical protein
MDKKAFISYSHSDSEFTDRLSKSLMEKGQDVFYDKWDIQPGDSIVEKIFDVGLSECSAFLIVLSSNSIKSPWVKEELNTATLRRIEKLTKVIPILIDSIDIPLSLRTLRWVDMRTNFEDGVRQILNSIHGVSDKPKLGVLADHLQNLPDSVGNLSKLATRVALIILELKNPDSEKLISYKNSHLAEKSKLTPQELNDAIDELEENGLIELINYLGTAPFNFGEVVPTYLIYHEFREVLEYDPYEDIKIVASAIAAIKNADGKALTKHTSLSYGRLNRAVEYLKDYGIIEVHSFLGTYPYTFGGVEATRKTRQFVEDL